MPSGRTHDRITLWALPWVTGFAFVQTRNANLTLLVAGGFIFGGLMFGPDLDIYSRQYKRWGLLRWIWIPYQKSLRHRSFLSHGPIIGTSLRVLYLGSIAVTVVLFSVVVGEKLGNKSWSWQIFCQTWGRSLLAYQREIIAVFWGLELAAMTHYLSDWSGSTYKRLRSSGIRGLLMHGKINKRQAIAQRRRRLRAKTNANRRKQRS